MWRLVVAAVIVIVPQLVTYGGMYPVHDAVIGIIIINTLAVVALAGVLAGSTANERAADRINNTPY